jgi:ribokinase
LKTNEKQKFAEMGVDIAVVGSFVAESAVVLSRIPVLGESLRADKYYLAPGGKGTNLAVAAARQGKNVGFVVKVGKDYFGQMALDLYEKEGIASDGIFVTDQAQTAIGLVFVQHSGENCTGIYMGANELLTGAEVTEAMGRFMPAKVVTAQLESLDDAILAAFRAGKENGAVTLLNTAPARKVDQRILSLTDIITPNESEAKLLAGYNPDDREVDMESVASKLLDMGPRTLVVTLGSRGSIVIKRGVKPNRIRPYKVDAIDTLGAGDCFSGSLAVGLSEGKSIEDAARWASVAAALSTLGNGGTTPLPRREQVEEHYRLYMKGR